LPSFPAYVDLPAGSVFLGAFLGFKLGDGAEQIRQFSKAVVPGIKFAGTEGDFLAYPAQVGPAGIIGKIVNGVSEQIDEPPVNFKIPCEFNPCNYNVLTIEGGNAILS